ncbi:MAG TPA: hypothetical protein VEJ67_00580 [Candidatus Cybelea sp.]|nr:hypothetical protein [Candidatus Cybelea sp.]
MLSALALALEKEMKTFVTVGLILMSPTAVRAQSPNSKQENSTSALVAKVPNVAGSSSQFNFERGQRVYVVAVDTNSRNVAPSDLEVERKATNQFRHAKVFVVSDTLRNADFVFFILVDYEPNGVDEIALAVSPTDYRRDGSDPDLLRNDALWQASKHINGGGRAALAGATMGASILFQHSGAAEALVKQFHKEALSK